MDIWRRWGIIIVSIVCCKYVVNVVNVDDMILCRCVSAGGGDCGAGGGRRMNKGGELKLHSTCILILFLSDTQNLIMTTYLFSIYSGTPRCIPWTW
jgi:hypothetical protein